MTSTDVNAHTHTHRGTVPATIIKKTVNTILPIESLPFYFRHPAFLASFALSLLYFTVLSFSGQMITYLISVGYTSWYVGVARVGSSIFEISATWAAPFLMKKIGVVRAGIWSLAWQMACLAGALGWYFSNFEGMGTNSLFSATGLAVGVALSRVGLWGYDLSAQNIIQDVSLNIERLHLGVPSPWTILTSRFLGSRRRTQGDVLSCRSLVPEPFRDVGLRNDYRLLPSRSVPVSGHDLRCSCICRRRAICILLEEAPWSPVSCAVVYSYQRIVQPLSLGYLDKIVEGRGRRARTESDSASQREHCTRHIFGWRYTSLETRLVHRCPLLATVCFSFHILRSCSYSNKLFEETHSSTWRQRSLISSAVFHSSTSPHPVHSSLRLLIRSLVRQSTDPPWPPEHFFTDRTDRV